MRKKYVLPFRTMLLVLSTFSSVILQSQSLPEFQAFTYTPVLTWNTAAYKSYQYNIPDGGVVSPMRFRLMTPNGFDRAANDGKKYPIIIFLHGSGECGVYDAAPNDGVGEQDNDKHLTHGGQTHMNAVLNNTFPGFLLYPQIRKPNPTLGIGPNWGFDNLKAVEYILRKLIEGWKVDPDRIYIHGLSLGGEGAWRFISWRPDLFAAAHPMSAAGTQFWKNPSSPTGYWTGEGRQRYKHLGLRLAQGALDKAPLPSDGNTQVDAIREIGGNIQYSYYPNLGHGTWNSEYAKPDFFSWFLQYRKNKIHVYGGQSSFCPGENFTVTLGLTPGFSNYQWVKNDTTGVPFATGASANEVTITQTVSSGSGVGKYYARFQRSNGVWTRWSPPVDVNSTRALSPTPSINHNGQSARLPSLSGSNDITLNGPLAKDAYVWKRDATTLSNTTPSVTVNTAGTYYLRTREPAGTGKELDGITPTALRAEPLGCLSAQSTGVLVTTTNANTVPATPGNFFAGSINVTSISLSWSDRSGNETAFELYRSTASGVAFQLVATIPANTTTYVDNGLGANKEYFYKLRAINNSGASASTQEARASTTSDTVVPTSPVLSLVSSSRTEIKVSWTGATDNVGIASYDLYQNGVLIATTSQTSFTVTGVTAFADYVYTVRTRDLANNVSVPSNQVSARAVNAGLTYEYYHHNFLVNAGEIVSKGSLVKTGIVSNFSIAPRTRNDGYAFIFTGYINIPSTGAYTFWTESSEGSLLYIDNSLVVNHDGVHTCTEKQGNTVNLSEGVYPIRLLNFENTGGECLTVRWQGPGFAKQNLPNGALSDGYVPPPALTAPTAFAASAASYNTINLTWADNSSNETGFEISRSTTSDGVFTVIKTTAAGATAYADNTLSSATQYFYKIRAVNVTSASSLVGPVNATTNAAPGAPAVPSSLAASVNNVTQVTLNWSDNSGNETGFEIQKSSQPGTGFIELTKVAANVESFVDTQVNSHATTYYRIRALGAGGSASAFSNVVSAVTGNRAPTIRDIVSRSIAIGSTFVIELSALDADNDPISFTFPNGLPGFASAQSNGYGKGTLTFTNAVAGTYNIRVQASDGTTTVFDDFVLTVNTNNSPVMSNIPFQYSEEGRTLMVTASATDADVGDVLTYTVANLPSFATWSSSAKRITFNPQAGHAGTYENITITVRDNKTPAGVDSKSFSLTVSPIDKNFTISVNFTTVTALLEGTSWNNTGTPTASDLTNLRDENNNVVKYVALNTGTNWTTTAPQIVDLPYAPNAIYTEKVRESFYRRSTGGTGSQMKIKGLNPAMEYKVTLYGAGGWIGSTPPANLSVLNTRYVIAGLTSQQLDLNTLNNTSNTVTSNLMKPSAAGEIAINVMRGPNNTNHYYINALQLTGLFDDGSAPLPPTNLTFNTPAHDTVKISWIDNSFETRFDILRASALSGPYTIIGTTAANVTTYTDLTTDGRTSYYYKVRAVNAAGSGDSEAFLVTTPNGKPIIAAIATTVVKAGQSFTRNITATDPEGDPIQFNALSLPSFASLTDNGNGTASVEFNPLASDLGTYTYVIEAVDNFSGRREVQAAAIVIDPAYDEIVYLNFKGTGSVNNAALPWNNIVAFTANTSIKNITGVSSSLQVRPRGGWTGSSNTSGTTAPEGGLFPPLVTKSTWSTSSTSTGATVALKGLSSSKRYNITLFGSINEFWFANTIYTINGVSKTLNTSKNTTGFVKFSGIAPAGDSIVVNVKRGPNVNASPLVVQRDGLLGAMIIEAATVGSNPVQPSNFAVEAVSKTSIRLTWNDNSSDETGFQVYRATTQGGPFTLIATTAANAESYTNTGLTKNKPYIYKIRAVKSGGASLYSDELTVSTYNQIILVNLNSNSAGGHMQASTPPWNNTATPPAAGLVFSNFKDDINASTSVDLEILSWGTGGTNNTGYITGSNTGIYPDAVLENYYYYEQFEAATTYRLTGLNSAYLYDLVFLGNEWTAATVNNLVVATDYSVGSRTVSQFNGKNTTSTVSIKGITPSSATIPFEIKANDAARYGVWNALEIRSYAPIPASFNTRIASADEVTIDEEMISMYPNPVEDRLHVMIHLDAVRDASVGINVVSAQGVSIVSDNFIHGEEGIEINTSQFSPGLYILKLNVGGKNMIKRFIKE